jgi:hypothetical protein
MQITIEMPMVADCLVRECAYNVDESCFARAITIGDGVHPGCDTFFGAPTHSRIHNMRAGVGACKVTACRHNDDLECQAERIRVARTGTDVRCMTFSAR